MAVFTVIPILATVVYILIQGVYTNRDQADQVAFGLDLTPLVRDDTLDPIAYASGFIQRFEQDVQRKLAHRLGR